MPTIAIINRSDADDGDVGFWAEAVDGQLREDFVPLWEGVTYTPVTFYAREQDLPVDQGIARVLILQNTLDLDNARGYHDFVDVPRSTVLFQGPRTSITISHEALEMTADPKTDKWVKMPDGRRVAVEVCDPVQGTSYTRAATVLGVTRNIEVSDFVTPAWFDATSVKPTDFNGLSSPKAFEVASGGYRIVADQNGTVSNEFGSKAAADLVAMRLRNATSRLRMRGLEPR